MEKVLWKLASTLQPWIKHLKNFEFTDEKIPVKKKTMVGDSTIFSNTIVQILIWKVAYEQDNNNKVDYFKKVLSKQISMDSSSWENNHKRTAKNDVCRVGLLTY